MKHTIYVKDKDIVEIVTPDHTFKVNKDEDTCENWKMERW